MFQNLNLVSVILAILCGCASWQQQVMGLKYPHEQNACNWTDGNTEWNEEYFKNHQFPEFDEIASFLQPIADQVGNEKCRKQLETYLLSLKNSSLWAVQMFDAGAKIPQGLLTSDAYDLGNYDGCVEINLHRDEEDDIFGKYCLVRLKVVKKEVLHARCPDEFDDYFTTEREMSTWTKLMIPVLKHGFINNVFRFAICVPNKCTPQDVTNIFQHLFDNLADQISNYEVDISVPENSCSTITESTFPGTFFNRAVLGIFIFATIITILDLLGWCSKSNYTAIQILMTFSAYRNIKKLKPANSSQHILVLDSLKVYTLALLVISRRLRFLLIGPILNRKIVDEAFDQTMKKTVFEMSNNIIVSTLLVIAGFLHFHKVYCYFRRNPHLKIRQIYLLQYLKTIPLYIVALSFYKYVFQHVGNGPMWTEKMENSFRNCNNNWAIDFFHLNDILDEDYVCIFESWYFAVIGYCFVTVPIVVRLSMKSSTTGLTAVALLTSPFVMLLLPLGTTYYNLELSGLPRHEMNREEWSRKIGAFERILPYFIGIGSSSVYVSIKEGKLNFSKVHCTILSTLGILFCIASCSLSFVLASQQFSVYQNLVIVIARQLLWSLVVSWIIVGVSTKKLTILSRILMQKNLVPLSRLTYPYLLILGFVQQYTVGIMRTLDYLSFPRLIWMSTADSAATYVFAFIFYMILHRPIQNVTEYVLRFQEDNQRRDKQNKSQKKFSKPRKKLN